MAEATGTLTPLHKVVDGVRPALIITRREIKDTLRDWRIVLPIMILVVGFPIMANFLAARAINFVGRFGADIIIERLYPFLMLVVGFFPSTFSLVIALETFVGEKERSSLEPLLATPLTDLQLYLGKLLASVTPPVIASYIGMAAYLLGLGFRLGWWPSVNLLLLAVALSTIKSVVMVAGAVIVSSQSTSVRAANLVASFIIVPMALLLQVEAWMLLYAHYQALWMVALALAIVASLLVRLGVRIFNREHLLGRDIDQLDLVKGLRTFWHAIRPHAGPIGFYRREIPGLLGRMKAELLVTMIVIFVGGIGLGAWAAHRFPLPAELFSFDRIVDAETVQELVTETGLLPVFSPGAVLLNNVRSLLLSAVLALLSLGTLALLLLMLPVAIIVYVSSQIAQVGINPWLFIGVSVLPHGVLELPAAIIATAQAMRMGTILLQPPSEGGGVFGVLRETGHFLKIFLLFVVPLLALAAWIEVRITPQLLIWFLGQAR